MFPPQKHPSFRDVSQYITGRRREETRAEGLSDDEQPAPASVGAPTARLVLGASKAAILPTGFLVRACRVRFHRTLEDVHAFGDLAGDGSAPRGLRDLSLAAAMAQRTVRRDGQRRAPIGAPTGEARRSRGRSELTAEVARAETRES